MRHIARNRVVKELAEDLLWDEFSKGKGLCVTGNDIYTRGIEKYSLYLDGLKDESLASLYKKRILKNSDDVTLFSRGTCNPTPQHKPKCPRARL